MGSGRPRSNTSVQSAGAWLTAPQTTQRPTCDLDEVIPATVVDDVEFGALIGDVTLLDDRVVVRVDGHVIAELTDGAPVHRLAGCLQRGHRYVGVPVNAHAVHVWNER